MSQAPNCEHEKIERRSTSIAWGRASGGDLVYIEDAEYGQHCGLSCPQCGHRLIAKNRCRKVSNHFAHAVTVECTGESAIHYAAKQILVEAASAGALLELPSANGVEHANDSLDARHDAQWHVERRSYALADGAEEQIISADLRVDVLVKGKNEPRSLAVEVLVTNPKTADDIEKFARADQDAIEIDLSNVAWNVDPLALRQAVLTEAPRHWLFGQALEIAATQAQAAARDFAAGADAKRQTYLDAFVHNYLSSNPRDWPIRWPRLTARAFDTDAFGKEIFNNAVRAPQVSDCIKGWVRDTNGWRYQGKVNRKTPVEIIAGLQDRPKPEARPQTPTLVILVPPHDDFHPSDAHVEWHQIDHWMAKLKELAARGLRPRLDKASQYRRHTDEFVARFHAASDKERLAIICELAGAPVPGRTGAIDSAWKAPYALWKTLVWHYKIQRRIGQHILVQQIAEDRWLDRLLGLGIEYDAERPDEKQTQRAKRVWFWLKDLERHGIVVHVRRQYFEVIKAPSDFIPWAYMKKD